MLELGRQGSIAVFNILTLRSNVILISSEGINTLHPSLDYAELEFRSDEFTRVIHFGLSDYAAKKARLTKILEWLWDAALELVLRELGFTESPSHNQAWPRIWWIASGKLNILPIHAAGYHDILPPGRTVIDRSILSYVPTIKSLIYAQERLESSANEYLQKVLYIGMPMTPNEKDLPSAETERDIIDRLLPDQVLRTILMNPSREAVLEVLVDHHIVHFACHGYFSEEDPSKSYLCLNDGNLTIYDVAPIFARSSKFAFLSLCHSAGTRNFRLLEEGIHLASAILISGFPSVVGTLWEITDADTPQVVEGVYRYMASKTQGIDYRKAAQALHMSIRELREDTRSIPGLSVRILSDPLIWASFVHVGC